MAKYEDFFSPEHVDEQIEQPARFSYMIDTQAEVNSRLVHDLQVEYANEKDDAASLARVWTRIAGGEKPQPFVQRTGSSFETRRRVWPAQGNAKPIMTRRLALLATVAVVICMLGSMIFIFAITRNARMARTSQATISSAPANMQTSRSIGKTIYTYTGQPDGIFSLNWSPDSRQIVSVSNTSTTIWDATTGANVQMLENVTPTGNTLFQNVRWSPDGKRLALSNDDVYIWDIAAGKTVLTFSYPPMPQANIPAFSTTRFPALGGGTGGVTQLSYHIGQGTRGAGRLVYAMDWSPDGKYIVSTPSASSNDNTVVVWDSSNGNVLTKFTGHSSTVLKVAWSPNGKYIASADQGGNLQIWEAATGKQVYTYHTDFPADLAWSPDSKRIAVVGANGAVQAWDVAKDGHERTYSNNGAHGFSAVAWSPDGTRIAGGGDGVQIWDATTGRPIYRYTGNPNAVRCLAWSPNGKYIASAEDLEESPKPNPPPNTVKVWLAN